MTVPAGQVVGARLTPVSWEERPARPPGVRGEECSYAGNDRHPPRRPGDAPAGGGKDSGGQDQDQLCRRGLRGLGPVAMPVVARSTILVRAAHIPALDPPPVTTPCCRRTAGSERGRWARAPAGRPVEDPNGGHRHCWRRGWPSSIVYHRTINEHVLQAREIAGCTASLRAYSAPCEPGSWNGALAATSAIARRNRATVSSS